MVSTTTVLCICITLLITLLGPVAALIIYALRNRKQGIVSAWFLGAAGFFVTQMIVRSSILGILSMQSWFMPFVENNYVIYAVILAFTAGLFEFAGRFAVAKIMEKNLTYKRGFAAGLGHGGIEAMLIVGMTYVSNLLYVVMINTGTFDLIVEQTAALGADTTALYQVQDALLNTAPVTFLLGGYERILTILCHVALTLIVIYYVKKQNAFKGALVCVALHTMLDGVSGLLMGLSTPYMGSVITQNTMYVIVYIFLTACAAGSVYVIVKIKKEMEASAESTEAEAPVEGM